MARKTFPSKAFAAVIHCVVIAATASLTTAVYAQFIFGGEIRRDERKRDKSEREREHGRRERRPAVGIGIELGTGLLDPGAISKPQGVSKGPGSAKKKKGLVEPVIGAWATDPTIAVGDRAELKGCCCCVDKLQLKFKGGVVIPARKLKKTVEDPDLDPVDIERDVGAQFGHEFRVFVTYQNKLVPGGQAGSDCVLRWFEKSDRPPASNIKAGVQPNQWTDIGLVLGARYPALWKRGTFATWGRRPKACPLPSKMVEITDKPAIFYDRTRTLEFDIIVESAPNCGCAHESLEIKAKQVLDEGPTTGYGKGHPETQFYGPDGQKMSTGETVEGTDRPLPQPAAATAGSGTAR